MNKIMMCGDMGSYSMVISLGVNLVELEEFTNTMGLWQNGSPIFLDLRRLSGRFLVSQMDKKTTFVDGFPI